MLLHEMPPAVVERTLAEAARLLRPGGRMVHLDFLPRSDPFDALIHFGHARRNNEPFMEPLARMDLRAPQYRAWRFPWTLIAARR